MLCPAEREAFDWVRAGNPPHELAKATGRGLTMIRKNLCRARKKMTGADIRRGRPPKAIFT